MRRAQSAVEYSFVIAIVVLGFIAIQLYVARGMQGRFQTTSDQMSDQYGHGVSDVSEHSQASAGTLEVDLPGLGAPNTIIWTRGSSSSNSNRGVAGLDENWP